MLPSNIHTREVPAAIVYDSSELRSYNRPSLPIPRAVRKTIFSLRIWRPAGRRPEPLSSTTRRPTSAPADSSSDSSSPSQSGTPPAPPAPTSPPSSPKVCGGIEGLRLGTLNAHSLGNKFMEIANTISHHNLDILVVTESWHSTSSDVSVRRAAPTGFSFLDAPRPIDASSDSLAQNYGGIVVFYRDHLRVNKIPFPISLSTFELLSFSCSSSRGPFTVLTLYRPGSSPLTPAFFSEFSALLEIFSTYNSQLIITGDLNIHLEDPTLPESARFLDLLSQFGLIQHVAEPTHVLGGWLDVVITREDCGISDLRVEPPSISDHGLLLYSIPFLSAQPTYALRNSRGWRNLNREAFRTGLLNSPLCLDLSSRAENTTEELFALFDSTVLPLIDTLLPLRSHRIRHRPLVPWFDSHCRTLRRDVRRLERKYRRSRDPADRLVWIQHLREMHSDFRSRETLYWEELIVRERSNPRRLWSSLAGVLGRSAAPCSPTQPSFTADDYLDYITEKIAVTRRSTEGSPPPSFPPSAASLTGWKPLLPDALSRLIQDSSSKSCELDLLPPFIIKEFMDEFLPFLLLLCNSSLAQGSIPVTHKRAVVFPSLKRQGLDPDAPSNYRPISNLSFLSKLLEKCISLQLVHYLDTNSLMPPLQSGFRKYHSTESLMTRLLADVFNAVDQGHVTLLALFDVSAAFDTVDHAILLERLSKSFGIADSALLWFRSFLSDRSLSVVFGSTRSPWTFIPYGLPQGSVLAPLLYILYTADLSDILTLKGVSAHQYADDTQAFAHGPASAAASLVARVLEATTTLELWMSSNRLRLNSDKTQFIWLGGRAQLAKIDMELLRATFPDVHYTVSVRDLGITLDPVLSLSDHVNRISRTCLYHLRQIRTIRHSLSPHAVNTLVHALICTRVDFGNSIFAGLSSLNLSKLQSILNASARLICGLPKYSHISTFIRETLHWLPVPQRIEFKILTLMRNSLLGVAPSYLQALCTSVSTLPGRSALRSAARGLLVVPRMRGATAQSRSFAYVGPSIWNHLPHESRLELLSLSLPLFRKRLKTILFVRALGRERL